MYETDICMPHSVYMMRLLMHHDLMCVCVCDVYLCLPLSLSPFLSVSLSLCLYHREQGNRETAALMLSYMRAEGVTTAAAGARSSS